jgi:hypothetical protein
MAVPARVIPVCAAAVPSSYPKVRVPDELPGVAEENSRTIVQDPVIVVAQVPPVPG